MSETLKYPIKSLKEGINNTVRHGKYKLKETWRNIESMHRMRDLENSHRDYGITGLSENFGIEDGIEEPYWEC